MKESFSKAMFSVFSCMVPCGCVWKWGVYCPTLPNMSILIGLIMIRCVMMCTIMYRSTKEIRQTHVNWGHFMLKLQPLFEALRWVSSRAANLAPWAWGVSPSAEIYGIGGCKHNMDVCVYIYIQYIYIYNICIVGINNTGIYVKLALIKWGYMCLTYGFVYGIIF